MARCLECKEKFIVKYFNQKFCLLKDGCIKSFSEYAKEKTKKEFTKKCSKERKEFNEKNKTISQWKNDLQNKCNLIARLIDFNQPCIATGKFTGKMAGGHCIGVGANDTIRFNLHNIHKQSFHSNSWKGGDNIRYQSGIVNRYGIDYMNRILDLQKCPVIKLSIPEINETMKIAGTIIKELKDISQHFDEFNPQKSIDLRTYYNKMLNIYPLEYQ